MLSQLCRRKMLIWTVEAKKPFNGRGCKTQRLFSVDPKMGGVYELLPDVVPQKPRRLVVDQAHVTNNNPKPEGGEAKVLPIPEIPTPTLTIKPQIVTIAKSAEFIDGLTVAEARALYQQLHKMFGEKA